MRVYLRFVAHAARRQTERLHGPVQIIGPVGFAQRQTFADGGLVNLNHLDSSALKVSHFVADSQRNLLCGFRARLVVAHKRPLQNGHRPRQHSLHRLFGQALRECNPVDGHWRGARNVAENDGRLHAARAVTLHPAVLCEHESVQLLAEILNHIVALKLAVNQHVEPCFFLPADRAGRLVLQQLVVFLRRQFALAETRAPRAHFGGLRERADGCGWEQRQVEPRLLLLAADGVCAFAIIV